MLSPKLAALVAELQSVSPMPDDETLNAWPGDEVNPLETFGKAIDELKHETQVDYPLELVPHLLEVFGPDTGNGGFWDIVTLVERYPNRQEIYPLIQRATKSSNPGTRAWCCYLLGRRRNME